MQRVAIIGPGGSGYRRTDRPRVVALLAALDGRIGVLRLTSRREVRRFAESRSFTCHSPGASVV